MLGGGTNEQTGGGSFLGRTRGSRTIFRDFLLFYQIFLSPKGKRTIVISNKHGIYEFPRELQNDLRLRKLGNTKKISIIHRIIAQCSVFLTKQRFCQYQQKTLQKLQLNFSHSVLFHTNTAVSLIYFGQDCRRELWLFHTTPLND